MKIMRKLPLLIALLFASFATIFGQDPEIEELKKTIEMAEKVRGFSVDFIASSTAVAPSSSARIKAQAVFIKQMPKGAVIEIGTHRNTTGDEAKNVAFTQQRADNLRKALIAAGAPAEKLVAKGYGSSEIRKVKKGEPAKKPVEYWIAKTGNLTAVATAASPVIIAGKGWGKVSIGATREDIDSVLGKPEYTGKDSINNESYATYFSKGFVVVFDGKMKARTLRFIGDRDLYANGDSKFESFTGMPDKGIDWGASSADVIKAYGEPIKREAYPDFPQKREILNLYYSNIHFIFKTDKLIQINIGGK